MTAGEGVEAVRARRRELQAEDDAISYVRRVAQARADLARAELAKRGAAQGAGGVAATEITDELRDVLADRLLGGAARPPRPAEDHSEDSRAAALDELCAEHGFGRLDELDPAALEALVAAIESFERDVSAQRRILHAELDALTDELVERLRDARAGAPQDGGAGAEDELGHAPGGHPHEDGR